MLARVSSTNPLSSRSGSHYDAVSRVYTSSHDSSKADGSGSRGAARHRCGSRLHGPGSGWRKREGMLPLNAMHSSKLQPRLLQENGPNSERVFADACARQCAQSVGGICHGSRGTIDRVSRDFRPTFGNNATSSTRRIVRLSSTP